MPEPEENFQVLRLPLSLLGAYLRVCLDSDGSAAAVEPEAFLARVSKPVKR